MKIATGFLPGKDIPVRYTCLGRNISLPLLFVDIPEATASLVLILEDIDAQPAPWIHWFLFDIPPSSNRTAEGTLPKGPLRGWQTTIVLVTKGLVRNSSRASTATV